MTECILLFNADVSLDEVKAIFTDEMPGVAIPIYPSSYQLGVDASYSAVKHALLATFPRTPFALAKTKEGKMFMNSPEV